MTIEMLEQERNLARKNGNKSRLLVLNDIIATVRKAETAGKKKVELNENMVNEALMKYRKMLKDGIKELPKDSALCKSYEDQLTILMEFCPPVVDDPEYILNLINFTLELNSITPSKKAKGQMMRVLMPVFKAQNVDTGVAMALVDSVMV